MREADLWLWRGRVACLLAPTVQIRKADKDARIIHVDSQSLVL